jgi:hypothetical protein
MKTTIGSAHLAQAEVPTLFAAMQAYIVEALALVYTRPLSDARPPRWRYD